MPIIFFEAKFQFDVLKKKKLFLIKFLIDSDSFGDITSALE
jgi:hypothetical protein